jgi:2'-5' RNA ligase
MRSAVVIPVRLPTGLERIRRANAADAVLGVPAHLTLLYPFVPAERLVVQDRTRLEKAMAASPAFGYELWSIDRWPDTLYVAPRPKGPFEDLAARLAADWPDWPLYGGGHAFEPHVTIAEPGIGAVEELARAVGRESLPARRRATQASLIVERSNGRWTSLWRFPLGGGR